MKTVELIADEKYSANERSAMDEALTEFAMHQILKVLATAEETEEGGFDSPLDKWDAPLKPVIDMAHEEGLLCVEDWEEGQEYLMTDEGRQLYQTLQERINSFEGVLGDSDRLSEIQQQGLVEFFRARYYGGCADGEFDDLDELDFEGLPRSWQKIIISEAFIQYLLHEEGAPEEQEELDVVPPERSEAAEFSSDLERDEWEAERMEAEEGPIIKDHLKTMSFYWYWPIFWFALFTVVFGYFLNRHRGNIFLLVVTGISVYFLCHFAFRRLTIAPEGLKLRTLFGTKEIAWDKFEEMSEQMQEWDTGSTTRTVHLHSTDGEEIAVTDWMYDYHQFLTTFKNNMGG